MTADNAASCAPSFAPRTHAGFAAPFAPWREGPTKFDSTHFLPGTVSRSRLLPSHRAST